MKLTPAASGLYFVGARRWAAVAFSAVVFFGTVGLSWLIIGDETRYYFTELLGDASRVGPVGTSFNQSWRGGISRILGHDAGYGPLVLAGLALWPVDRSGDVLRKWRDYVDSAPDELSTGCAVLTAPPEPFVPQHLRGGPVLAIVGMYVGDGHVVHAPRSNDYVRMAQMDRGAFIHSYGRP